MYKNRVFNTYNLQGFKVAFKHFKVKYTFVCFTLYGAIFSTNYGFLALFKPV